MVDYDAILGIDPYSLNRVEKEAFLINILRELTRYHEENCPEYRRILCALGLKTNEIQKVEEIPFLPVRLFKEFELRSVPIESVVKTMMSSATTGQAVSKIFLDRDTASYQTKALSKIVSSYIGSNRLPMIILDSRATVKDRLLLTARGAGILGFSFFGRDRIYALDDHMNLDIDAIGDFLAQHLGERIMLFGFTFMIWQHFYKALATANKHLDLSNGILIHGGGWKKLVESRVSSEEFKKALYEVCGIKQVYDYYGMVEQTGTINMECEWGFLHASIFSDIIVRKPSDFSPAKFGEQGIIQTLSIFPRSYPGHSLLTEDEGVIQGEDDCRCGRKGKYFNVLGRIKNAEIRGCSDTYASKF